MSTNSVVKMHAKNMSGFDNTINVPFLVRLNLEPARLETSPTRVLSCPSKS